MATPFQTAFNQQRTDPYYTLGQFQQSPTVDWTTTQPIGGPNGYIENNPEVAWTRYLQGRYGVGLADQSPYAGFVRGQYQPVRQGFEAALAENPTLIFQDYLNRLNPDYARMFAALTPQQRGESVSQYAGPLRVIADI